MGIWGDDEPTLGADPSDDARNAAAGVEQAHGLDRTYRVTGTFCTVCQQMDGRHKPDCIRGN
jgi:hypothetical protein